MIFEKTGKAIISDIKSILPSAGRSVYPDVEDREENDISRGLTPDEVDRILKLANTGETSEQCRLALEIEEKNWDIAQTLETRRNAVLGVPWTIEPGDDTPAAQKVAEALEVVLAGSGSEELELASFDELLGDLLSALLPGFAISEIAWTADGLAGFFFVDQRHFTFKNGFKPQLVTTDEKDGVELPPHKFIIHKLRKRGGDPARGGLIRPLAWLHCFQNINAKDLLRFIERYGMPFAMATVDKDAWENDRNKIKQLIRNFGPDGGGVFTKSVELKLVEASRSNGDVYFKLLEYLEKAITKVVLGQTATSGDGGGLSGDNAQSDVRQDILEADCSLMENTINTQVIKPWHNFNNGESTPAPKFVMHCEPPEDIKATAETVKTLFEGGLETDEKEMSEKFGMKLTRIKTIEASGTGTVPSVKSQKKDSIELSADNITNGPTDQLATNAIADFVHKPIINWAENLFNTKELDNPVALSNHMEKEFNAGRMFDTVALAQAIENTIYAAAVIGKAEKATDLISKERKG